MRTRNDSGANRWRSATRWLPCAVAMLAAWPCADARADESEATEDGPTLVRNASPDPEPQTLSTFERFARELTWARWMLAEDVPIVNPELVGPALPPPALLGPADLRADHWQSRPMALTTTASALGSSLIAGLPVLGVVRNGKIRQRHFVRAFFKSRGVSLVWRIEF